MPAMMKRTKFNCSLIYTCYFQYDTISKAFINTFTVLALEHHDLQKCIRQNQGGPGCKEENPAPQWLLRGINSKFGGDGN